MTQEQHPITPPPELVRLWQPLPAHERERLKDAYRLGADQELEACCQWLAQLRPQGDVLVTHLRATRRPQPPSLKEQALAVVENSAVCDHLSTEHAAILRRALEALDD